MKEIKQEQTHEQKLSEKQAKKEALKTRVKTAFIYILSWLLLYIVLDALSSGVWMNYAIKQNVRLAFCFLNMVLVVPILFFSIKEICNLCFPKSKKIFIAYAVVTFIVYIALSVILLLSMPSRANVITPLLGSAYNAFCIWVIVLCSSVLLLYISGLIMCGVMKSKHMLKDNKPMIIFPFLIFFITLFACAFFYISIVHSWTTCLILTLLPMIADATAYFSGMAIGKRKMCPKISPKKTWGGLIGSILLTTLIMCGLYALFFINNAESKYHSLYSFLGCQTCSHFDEIGIINIRPYFWAIYICVTMLFIGVSTTGDLFFSWIKRKFEIKDFSDLLPGHGGMLDRIDSMTFVFILYFVVTIILQAVCRKNGVNPGVDFLWKL